VWSFFVVLLEPLLGLLSDFPPRFETQTSSIASR
jgi:hypothetical protein